MSLDFVCVVSELFQCRIKANKRINLNHLTSVAFEAVIFLQVGKVPYICKTSHNICKMSHMKFFENGQERAGWNIFNTSTVR